MGCCSGARLSSCQWNTGLACIHLASRSASAVRKLTNTPQGASGGGPAVVGSALVGSGLAGATVLGWRLAGATLLGCAGLACGGLPSKGLAGAGVVGWCCTEVAACTAPAPCTSAARGSRNARQRAWEGEGRRSGTCD